MSHSPFQAWLPRLRELGRRLQTAVRAAQAAHNARELARVAGEGAGDVTFTLDVHAEEVVSAWLAEQAAHGPLSLLSEDAGWRHRGPQGELAGFDHGGPRISIDPVDGTRPLAADLRSAWVVIGFAPPGPGQPRLRDLSGGVVVELPTRREAWVRVLWAERGGTCWMAEGAPGDEPGGARALLVDHDARPDHGVFSFFRYHPLQRVAVARLEEAFFARLAAHEGADLRACYDDAYCSSAAHLVLLALGTYRFLADLRSALPGPSDTPTTKPYDLAGALVVAEAAGVVVLDAEGEPLDSPLDASTRLSFVGYCNAETAARLGPHLAAAREGLA
ncbi:MAG: inositol monophosphatase family protein [Planctomycetota bacterium]